MFAGAKVSGAVILAWLLLSVPRSEGAESIRQQLDKIAEVALQKTGLDQIREINLSINTLLNTTHFFLKSPETDHRRSVDSILDSKYRDNCKDFVVLKTSNLRAIAP
jgi:hypothetical protein